jgi:tRNA 2-selenouridine synthase
MNEISYEESLQLENSVYIDVRSPGEFAEDHIPGAVNLPIFDDKERSEVGTLYKVTGRDEAIIRGSEIAGGKLRELISNISFYKNHSIVFTCARGGMRSSALASLSESIGLKVYKLKSGYKGYRHYVNGKFSEDPVVPPFFIIQGLTGTGKTEIINHIENSIDLEGMAGHRSSIFGAIGLKQNSQKNFETLLLSKIFELNSREYIAVEGESRKIGNLVIPDSILNRMRNSKAILIEADIERRAEIILKEYTKTINKNEIIDIVKSLKVKIGQKTIDELESHIMSDEYIPFIKILLEKYYDPLYEHSIAKYEFIAKIKNTDSKAAAEEVISEIKKYLIR